MAEDVEEILEGDSLRLSQILQNLISNALKFTPAGKEILLRIENRKKEEGVQWIRFQVKDTGKGIAKEKQEKIFQAFEQEDETIPEQFGGTGLGLSIVKRFTEMLGGEIWVESELGKGSTFTVELPFGYLSEPHLPESGQLLVEEKRKSYDFQGKRILVVEDTLMNVEILCELLQMTGAETEAAYDGKEAVEKFRQSSKGYYDAILMDVQMPKMDGYEATRQIRGLEREDAKSIAILAMTANAFKKDVEKSLESGMNGHLSKPIEVQSLYRGLDEVF